MYFDIVGPFDYLREVGSQSWKAAFWADVDGKWEGLSGGVGCYVFSIRFGQKLTPWYVGKTASKGGSKSEVFQAHKLVHYEDAIKMGGRGAAQITFIPMVTPERWALSRAIETGAPVIEKLEQTLIGMCLGKNPEMRNSRDTRFNRNVFLNGILGEAFRGRPTINVAHGRRLLR